MRQVVLDTETTGLEPEAGHRIIEIGADIGPPVDQRTALRAGMAQERITLPPDADLQQLLAKDRVERAPNNALLSRQAATAQRRLEPAADAISRILSHRDTLS